MEKQNKKTINLKSIIDEGGSTLDKNGERVQFSRGYQVSFKDCYKTVYEKIKH